jgi:hypothetical protein
LVALKELKRYWESDYASHVKSLHTDASPLIMPEVFSTEVRAAFRSLR